MIFGDIRLSTRLVFITLFSTLHVCGQLKVVVTGGAGFIGSHVAERLLERGDRVIVIDNLNDAYDQRIKRHNLVYVARKDTTNKSLQIYKADICNKRMMQVIFEREKPDVICHLAARAGVRPSIDDPEEYMRSNIMGTLVMFEMAKQFNINHVVFASSSSVYGERGMVPFKEDDPAGKQSSPYGMTKRAGELLAYTYHYLYHISITCLRFFTVYGPRGRIDMAPFIFLNAIHQGKKLIVFGDGSAIRDFTYIDDIVDGVIRSIDKSLGYEILNLGRGEPIVLIDFIRTVEKIVGKKAIIEHTQGFAGDVSVTHADVSKAQELLGYAPKTSVEEGMRSMYEWYLKIYALF